jgi:hypothetical protein
MAQWPGVNLFGLVEDASRTRLLALGIHGAHPASCRRPQSLHDGVTNHVGGAQQSRRTARSRRERQWFVLAGCFTVCTAGFFISNEFVVCPEAR